MRPATIDVIVARPLEFEHSLRIACDPRVVDLRKGGGCARARPAPGPPSVLSYNMRDQPHRHPDQATIQRTRRPCLDRSKRQVRAAVTMFGPLRSGRRQEGTRLLSILVR
jgi:hypothetical protein